MLSFSESSMPDLRHPHLAEDVDRLLADRTAADDEHPHVVAGEGAHPGRARLAEAAVAELEGVVAIGGARLGQATVAVLRRVERTGGNGHQWNSRCGSTIGPGYVVVQEEAQVVGEDTAEVGARVAGVLP